MIVLLPTRSSTASSCLASGMRLESHRPFQLDAVDAEGLQHGEPLAATHGTNSSRQALTAMLTAAWPKEDVLPDDEGLALLDLQIAEQAGPGRRVSLGIAASSAHNDRTRSARRSRPAPGVFGIAAVDRAAEAAHQRGHLGADRRNSPPGQDFTRPTHSMPLTSAASAHFARRMCISAWLIPNALIWMTTCTGFGSGSGMSL